MDTEVGPAAKTLPARYYTDPELYRNELERFYCQSWICAGRSEQASIPGEYFLREIAGESIIITRSADHQVRAFYNVCRHRAAQVMNEPAGKATKLRCRYHGWTYDLTGQLRGTPEFDGVADFRREDNGLVGVAVDTWGPLVFVKMHK